MCGNKADSKNHTVSLNQGQSLARRFGIDFCQEVSAKEDENVNEVFR